MFMPMTKSESSVDQPFQAKVVPRKGSSAEINRMTAGIKTIRIR